MSDRFSRVDNLYLRTGNIADHVFQNRVVSTAQNQSVDVAGKQHLQIVTRNEFRGGVVDVALFCKRNEEGTGTGKHFHVRFQACNCTGVRVRTNCRLCSYNTNTPVTGFLHGKFRTGLQHTQHRNISRCFLHDIERQCRNRIACRNDKFRLIPHQNLRVLPCVTPDSYLGFRAVRNPGCITEINDPFGRQKGLHGPDNSKPTDTGIKNANRAFG